MGGAPPPPQGADPTDDDAGRPVAGRRGEEPEKGPDKRLIWGAVGAGVLIVAVVVGIQIAKKDPAPEKKPEDSKSTAKGEPVMNLDTPEGRAAFEKMLSTAPPEKATQKIGALSAEGAVKIKEALIAHMLRQDAGRGLTDAWNIAERLSGLKDERILKKIIDLALVKTSAASLLKPYGAMGSQAVIDRAKAEPANAPAFTPLLLECRLAEAAGPMVAAAETCEIPEVAWICGDALYDREVPVAIKLERVQAWLADPSARAKASGVRQMALQKGTDRDAAIAPFTTAETPREIQIAVLDVLAKVRDLSTDHMRNLLAIEDLETFEECMKRISEKKLFEYIPELKKMGESAGTQRGRRASKTANDLEFILKAIKK
ncbi:MAG: hypothetical protein FD180_5176 [Planctomycetota bacterium]|nr:MAG: hypothetical protein FD180_5176 [Planctomycetota bacterium]